MKKLLTILFILFSVFAFSQSYPPGYTGISARYDWLAGKFRALHVPGFATTPTLTAGQFTGAGAIGLDTVLHRLFIYSGGSWRRIALFSDIGTATGAQGDIQYFSALNTISNLTKDANATRYLSNIGTSNNPAWAQINLANGVTGTLPIANGGSGQTTANTALNAFLPTQTSNSGKFLTTDGSNSSWATVSGGTPGGSNTQVQFNNSGAFGGSSNFSWDNSAKTLLLTNAINANTYLSMDHSTGGYIRFGTISGSGNLPAITFRPDGSIQNESWSLNYVANTADSRPAFTVDARTTGEAILTNKDIFGVSSLLTYYFKVKAGGNSWFSNRVGVGNVTSPTAWLHAAAGTTSEASLRIADGVAPSSPNAGDIWRATFLKTYQSSAIRRFVVTDDATASNGKIPIGNGTDFTVANISSADGTIQVTNGAGTIDLGAHMKVIDWLATDGNNSGTSETDLHSYTIQVNTLNADGQSITGSFNGTLNDVTATAQLKIYFAGTVIWNTGSLTVSATGGWKGSVEILRVTSTTARVTVSASTPGASTAVYTQYTALTSLDFTTTNILKVTGQAGGAGGGSNDITATMSKFYWTKEIAH